MTAHNAIHIAVLALGGQGGGVLVNWIVALAESRGWVAQATSIAGVAQRTGATIYYIEMVPPPAPGVTAQPVLAQMATPGDVDIVIAAELMEAGRATQRGFVTPQRTTLITSTHRTLAVQEKMVPGNGLSDGESVLQLVRSQSKRLIAADMNALARKEGSVISASLFGALAGSQILPFALADFEAVVRAGGVGVEPSVRALRAGADLAERMRGEAEAATALDSLGSATAPRRLPERAANATQQALLARIRKDFPRSAWDMLGEGVARLLDYQDAAYARDYLDAVAPFVLLDANGGERDQSALTCAAAHWVAVAMAYDDVQRVADLKIRAARFARIRGEVRASGSEPIGIEDFMHPRLDELAGLLPKRLGEWVLGSAAVRRWLQPRLEQGRRLHPHTLFGFVQLWALAALRPWRRGSLRHGTEIDHIRRWLGIAREIAEYNPALAYEVLCLRQLVKGYSDTHARGRSRFDRALQAASDLRRDAQAARTIAALRKAALADAKCQEFDALLAATPTLPQLA